MVPFFYKNYIEIKAHDTVIREGKWSPNDEIFEQ